MLPRMLLNILSSILSDHFSPKCILAFLCCCLVTKLCPPLCNPWPIAYQALLSMGFSRQEYWSELPSPATHCRSNLHLPLSHPFLFNSDEINISINNMLSKSIIFIVSFGHNSLYNPP